MGVWHNLRSYCLPGRPAGADPTLEEVGVEVVTFAQHLFIQAMAEVTADGSMPQLAVPSGR